MRLLLRWPGLSFLECVVHMVHRFRTNKAMNFTLLNDKFLQTKRFGSEKEINLDDEDIEFITQMVSPIFYELSVFFFGSLSV